MKFQIRKKIGDSEIIFSDEFESQLEFFKKAAFAYSIPSSCGKCKSQNLKLDYRTPKGYEYVYVCCLDCKQELHFGQHKENKTLFTKNWEPPYAGERNENA
jgi:hypothetical protein